jgi:ComF family protein
MQFFKNILSDVSHIFYPHLCTGCSTDILGGDSLLCARCFIDLPQTNFAEHAGNPIEKIFWGRIPLAAACSEFYFAKESLIQHLVHQLKYKSNQAIGVYLGELMGKSMKESNRFNNIDGLIPLPLYPDKEKKRGYNQATVICNGMAAVMNVPVLNDVLRRKRYTETQTKKHRTERWENVADSFVLNNEHLLKGKKLILVDDVVTTGATLEASGNTLLQIEGVELSIATLTFAAK